jgi:hypothetical protein
MCFSGVLTFFWHSNFLLLPKGLTFLKMRVAVWRYQRGSRSLAANLSAGDSTAHAVVTQNPVPQNEEEMSEDFEVPDGIEEMIEELIQGLRDSDNVIR